MISFYCKPCGLDQNLKPYKRVNSFGEWFVGRCKKCNKELIRYTTDFKNDPYFYESKKVKIEARKNAVDLIQYGEPGFKTHYRKSWEEFEKQKEVWEKEQERKENEKKAWYQSVRHDINDRQMIKRAIQAEEKLDG